MIDVGNEELRMKNEKWMCRFQRRLLILICLRQQTPQFFILHSSFFIKKNLSTSPVDCGESNVEKSDFPCGEILPVEKFRFVHTPLWMGIP